MRRRRFLGGLAGAAGLSAAGCLDGDAAATVRLCELSIVNDTEDAQDVALQLVAGDEHLVDWEGTVEGREGNVAGHESFHDDLPDEPRALTVRGSLAGADWVETDLTAAIADEGGTFALIDERGDGTVLAFFTSSNPNICD